MFESYFASAKTALKHRRCFSVDGQAPVENKELEEEECMKGILTKLLEAVMKSFQGKSLETKSNEVTELL
jgi:hypothetical protein